MQQERKITEFQEVEWTCDLHFEQLYWFRNYSCFYHFPGGTPPKIFNNFLFMDFLQSAKS